MRLFGFSIRFYSITQEMLFYKGFKAVVEHAAGLFPNGLAAAFYESPVFWVTNGTMKN